MNMQELNSPPGIIGRVEPLGNESMAYLTARSPAATSKHYKLISAFSSCNLVLTDPLLRNLTLTSTTMTHPSINEEAFQALLSVVRDSPIHFSLSLFLQYIFLVLLLGKCEDNLFTNGRLNWVISTRNTFCALPLLTLDPRVSIMRLRYFENTLTISAPSHKDVHRSSVRAMLATVILLYVSTCGFTIALLQYAVVTSRGYTAAIVAQIYSTNYIEKGFADADLAVTTAKTATVVINVSADSLFLMINAV